MPAARTVYLLVLVAATLVFAAWSVWPGPARDLPELDTFTQHIAPVAQRQRVLGYDRDEFGHGWGRAETSACTSREIAIQAQTSAATVTGCRTSGGQLHDPYSNGEIDLSAPGAEIEVDHVFPLSAAWDLGAYLWEPATRRDFANDPLNLVVTSKENNQNKSDQLPAAWLPPSGSARCWYVTRLAAVAAKYQLQLPQRDLEVMKHQCRFRIL